MTENEAIKILQGAIKKPNTQDGYLGQAVTMAIQALEDAQQYRAIGTVEEFQHFITAWDELKILIDIAKNELSQYKSIGTIEEFKALKDGSIPIIHGKAELELYGKEIRAKAIDEFAERLKSDEFQKYNLDMVFETARDLSYSHCINAFHEYVDEIAEQMKGGE